MDHQHSIAEIRDRLGRGTRQGYLRDWILGALDGSVTTFAAVAGVVAAGLSADFVLIVGAANIVADGFSMAVANYSGTRGEAENIDRLRAIEERHLETFPEGEIREVREIFRRKGFTGASLEQAVQTITADREIWLNTMLVEEYGTSLDKRSPLQAALSAYAAFLLCGLVPLVPFVLAPGIQAPPTTFVVSLIATTTVFFIVGALKSLWSIRIWWRSGFETLALGLGAATFAYAIGYGLRAVL